MDLKEKALNAAGKRHPWELARIEVIASLLRSVITNPHQLISVFDIGSGDAFVIQELAKRFKNASFFAVDTGYEQEYTASANLRFKQEGLSVRLFKSMEQAEAACKNTVQIVLLLDVMEHVPNDVAFLNTIAKSSKINNDTAFLITVPAFQALFCSHDVFLEHYRRYSNTSLKESIKNAGLITEKVGYFFMFPLVFRIFRVLREKLIPASKASGIGNWQGGTFVSKCLYSALLIDFRLSLLLRKMHLKLPGLSNFAICRKSV